MGRRNGQGGTKRGRARAAEAHRNSSCVRAPISLGTVPSSSFSSRLLQAWREEGLRCHQRCAARAGTRYNVRNEDRRPICEGTVPEKGVLWRKMDETLPPTAA